MTRVAYFTAGNAGVGHLARGAAISRAFARAGTPVDYRMFGPALPFAAAKRADYQVITVRPEELGTPEAAQASSVLRDLSAFAPDLVLVDLFWAPLRFVLPSLRCEAWLLARCCPPRWWSGPQGVPFAPEQYARVLAIEPFAPPIAHEPHAPIVGCNRAECPPREQALARLGAEDVVVHAGLPGDLAQLLTHAPPWARVFDLFEPSAPFPIAPLLPSARSVTGSAGYNLFWESKWLGFHDRCRFVPFVRSIDDPAWRVRECGAVVMRDNGADLLARAVSRR